MDANRIDEYRDDPTAFLNDLQYPAGRFGDIAAPFQRERNADIAPALLAVAAGRVPETGRYWFEATKGASKDTDLAACLLWLLTFSPRMLRCQVGAADRDQANELRLAAKQLLTLNPLLTEAVEVQQWSILSKRTESVCEIIASDIAGSHGARPDVLILNELTHVQKREFAENLMDNATKVPGGIVVIATNCGFLDTWQFDWREDARTDPRWSFHKFASPAPWLAPAEIAAAQRRNTRNRFARLWQGDWVPGTGDGLDYGLLKRCVSIPSAHPRPIDGITYFGSVDLGVSRDWSAFIIIGLNRADRKIETADVHTWNPQETGGRIDLDSVERKVLDEAKRFRFQTVLFDPKEGALMMRRLARAGLNPIEWKSAPKYQDEIAIRLQEVVRAGTLALYDDGEGGDGNQLIRDLSKLRIIEKAYGYRIEFPRDAEGHCDRGAALCQAIPMAVKWLDELMAMRPEDAEEAYIQVG